MFPCKNFFLLRNRQLRCFEDLFCLCYVSRMGSKSTVDITDFHCVGKKKKKKNNDFNYMKKTKKKNGPY